MTVKKTDKGSNVKKKSIKKEKKANGAQSKERILKIAGVLFIAISLFLVLSFISYILYFNEDYTLLSKKSFFELMFKTNAHAQNVMGKFGLWTAYIFITRWFGVASFLFAPYLLVIGSYLLGLFKVKVWVFSRRILFFLIWFSVTFAFIFGENIGFGMGGFFGKACSDFLIDLIGKLGTVLLLFAILITYSLLEYDFILGWLEQLKVDPEKKQMRKEKRLKRKEELRKKKEAKKKIRIAETEESAYNLEEYAVDDEKDDFEIISYNEKKGDVEDNDGADIELVFTNNNIQQIVDQEDIELSIDDQQQGDKISDMLTEETEEDKKHFGLTTPFDPTLELPDYKFPEIDLLESYNDNNTGEVNAEELNANKNRIVETLNNYGIKIDKIKATIGPTVTLYEIIPAAGVRISRIKNLEDDIALSLAALGIRIIAPIPGKGTIGIEVPNSNPSIVSMRSVLASDKFKNTKHALPIALGKTISNETYVVDLAKMPHLLMAGATGQGKSVGINAVIASLLYKKHPSELKFVLVDPKKVELSLFSKIERHYLAKLPDSEDAIIPDTRTVVKTLNSLTIEMDNRYELLKDAQVRNIREYNEKFCRRQLNPLHGHRYLPYIVLIVDEFADLIMTAGKEVENPIARLAQLSRAIGIHLIIATQRPSVNIITGVIKANFPARVAFRVSAKVDSRTILDTGGADQLIGRGDMLLSSGSDIIRLQCAFIDTPEVERMTDYIGSQRAYPEAFALPEVEDEQSESKEFETADRDPLFEDAARIIVLAQQGSTSLLQRKLKLGYNRAGRLIDQLEAAGIVGPFEGSKAREVKIGSEMALEQYLKDIYSNNKTNDSMF
ncbi:MAG: DNA translocase FtsK [Bacteroidales bacterium]|jgi:S-DNA-T family DNA segregation ATPase FtsK/SpoIIIE|nr:DNA translocase FtsK [Bacteroidales bacterium]